jgi:hypothetical protein
MAPVFFCLNFFDVRAAPVMSGFYYNQISGRAAIKGKTHQHQKRRTSNTDQSHMLSVSDVRFMWA